MANSRWRSHARPKKHDDIILNCENLPRNFRKTFRFVGSLGLFVFFYLVFFCRANNIILNYENLITYFYQHCRALFRFCDGHRVTSILNYKNLITDSLPASSKTPAYIFFFTKIIVCFFRFLRPPS